MYTFLLHLKVIPHYIVKHDCKFQQFADMSVLLWMTVYYAHSCCFAIAEANVVIVQGMSRVSREIWLCDTKQILDWRQRWETTAYWHLQAVSMVIYCVCGSRSKVPVLFCILSLIHVKQEESLGSVCFSIRPYHDWHWTCVCFDEAVFHSVTNNKMTLNDTHVSFIWIEQ